MSKNVLGVFKFQEQKFMPRKISVCYLILFIWRTFYKKMKLKLFVSLPVKISQASFIQSKGVFSGKALLFHIFHNMYQFLNLAEKMDTFLLKPNQLC